jgi:hypothetical protein
MPTLFHYLGLRFHFYSNDHLPIHVSIETRKQIIAHWKEHFKNKNNENEL